MPEYSAKSFALFPSILVKAFYWSLIIVCICFTNMSCNKPSEPEFSNPYDTESDNFISQPSLNTISVTNITTNSALSGGSFTNNYGYPITSKGVCWGTDSSPTTAGNCTDKGSGTSDFSSTISGLSPDTQYFVRAYATNSEGTTYGSSLSFFTNTPSAPTLCEAVDNCSFQFVTAGDGGAEWTPQTIVTFDGIDAAESGSITHDQATYLATTLEGPGILSFSSKVDSEQGYDTLTVAANGTEYGLYHLLTEDEKNNNAADWYSWTLELPQDTTYDIFWIYRKDGSLSEGADKAWVDQVSFASGKIKSTKKSISKQNQEN